MNEEYTPVHYIPATELQKPAELKRTIRGQLTPTNSEAIANDPRLLSLILQAFRDNGLKELTLWSVEWDGKKLVFNDIFPAYDGHRDYKVFINKLYCVIQTETVTELGLTGGFTFVVDTPTYPEVTRIMVRNGKIAYQASKYVWDDAATVVPAPEEGR